MLKHDLFQNIQKSKKQILTVTKYWDKSTTLQILWEVQTKYPQVFFGIWENRIQSLEEKQIPREHVHFIGNIQSRKISEIVKHCSVIHSLASLKHAQKIEYQQTPTKAFIQIQLDPKKQIGIPHSELQNFLSVCASYKYLDIIWISGMGSLEFSESIKRKEFQKLIKLRNDYIPNWLISAGTSRDYILALEEWVDIVRIGQKILTDL